MERIDPYRSKENYLRWKERTADGIPGVTASDSEIIRRFLTDMERGVNIGRGSKKGGRSYLRLNTLRNRLVFLARGFEQRCGIASLEDVTEDQAHEFFGAMRSGDLPKRNGKRYRSTGDYVRVFKAFWHWRMKVARKRSRSVDDICLDLDTSCDKPAWVYLSEDDVRKLAEHARYDYRVLILFLFDSGIRSPTELVNVRVVDLLEDGSKLRIRDETSKTFGRTISLLLCRSAVRRFVADRGLRETDRLFPINPQVTNRYLRRLARRVLGDGRSLGCEQYPKLSMYDFRHSSACYWLPRYPSESALKYRFGWKKSEMIHYYTNFLGMRDTITEEDLSLGPDKTGLQRQLQAADREKRLLAEQVRSMQAQMKEILGVVTRLSQRIEVDGCDGAR